MTIETLDPSQRLAVELMCAAPFGIVTGGPGRGKTHCLRTALDQLDAAGQRYELAAPTGKAAKRIQESTGRSARTIHRLLGWTPQGFTHNERKPIPTDVVFVDESSMLDIELAASLTCAIGPRSRLILIGDADQLPPVGPGRVFGDLVDHGSQGRAEGDLPIPVVRLTHLHRSAADSWVALNAPKILVGEMPDLNACKDFRFIKVDESANLVPKLVELITKTIPQEIDADAQVIIPQRPGLAGIDTANKALQAALNPMKPGQAALARKDGNIRIGDRVIQTRNDYNVGVFNGEIGDVIDIAEGGCTVNYIDREPVKFDADGQNGLQLAYALTCHRTQGSEFPWAVVVCHSTHTYILTRQLIYTAVTRAKQGVILVGDEKGLRVALSDKKPPKRNTALIERMRGSLA